MQSSKVLLLRHLEELDSPSLKMFQWFLTKNMREGYPSIPRSRLEDADRMDTVENLVTHYGENGAVETTLDILILLNRNDLVLTLTEDKRHFHDVSSSNARETQTDEDSRALSCLICHNIFTEPVTLTCGHSFCRTCLHQHWRWEICRKCPLCPKVKQVEAEPQINLALRTLTANYKERRRRDHIHNLTTESAPSIQAVVHHLQPSNTAQNGACLVAPTIIGSSIRNINISILSGQGILNCDTAYTCGTLQPQRNPYIIHFKSGSKPTNYRIIGFGKKRKTEEKNAKGNVIFGGRDWFTDSTPPHRLFYRRPEATSLGRAIAFNRTTAGEFFDELAKVMDRYKFPPHMIYNVGKTDVSTMPTSMQMVAVIEKKQVQRITSADGGELVTVVCAVNAIGNAVPPMFVFPGATYNDYFITGAPTGSIGASTTSGSINKDTFTDFLEHLVQHTNCSSDHPILLIFDNHKSHVSQSALQMAKRKGIVMLTVPPHTSHHLQPLDRSVFGPFRTYYNSSLEGWMRSNPSKTASIYQIPGCVNDAFMSAMTIRNISSGFRSTGIFPFNRDIFSDEEFEPSMVSDRPNPELQCAAAVSASTSAELPAHACASPSGTDSQHAGYVSATQMDLSKSQQPRTKTKRLMLPSFLTKHLRKSK